MDRVGELPLVTVITPTYNRASYVGEVIESVLEQDYPNVEYIVLDDGSTDDTLEVVRRYEGRLRLEAHENMGETRTVNKGFSMASGEIVGVVNSDDPLLPGAISKIAARFVEDPELLVAYPDWVMIDAEGEPIEYIKTYDYDYLDMLRWHHCVPGPAAFFRRRVVEELGGRDPGFRYVGDLDFWMRAGLLGPFVRVPETLATFRFHPDSFSVSQLGQVMADEHVRSTDKIFALPNLPKGVRKARREAYSSTYYIAGVVSGGNVAPSVKRRYFLLALRHAPLKYLTEYRERLFVMLPMIFGRYYYPLRHPLGFVSGKLRRIGERLRRLGGGFTGKR